MSKEFEKSEEMRKSVFIINTPKDCLHCKMRTCLYISDKHYQLCGLQIPHYGYGTEAFFKDEDLKDNWISPKCPLINEEEFIYNSDIYNKVTSVEYIAKTYEIDAIMAIQYDLQ